MRAFDLRIVVPLLAASLPSTSLSAQRGPTQLTTAPESHQDALVSPDGQTVAFKGPLKLGVVAWNGGGENTIVSGSNLGSFLWSPTSSGLYYLDSTSVKYVARTGGTPRTVGPLTGATHRIYCVDSQDKTLYGTRYDAASGLTWVFSLATNGASQLKDEVSSAMLIDDVRIDPSDAYLLFRDSLAVPFSPREYWRYDLATRAVISVSGGPLQTSPESAHWLDNGQTIAFSELTPAVPQLARIGPPGSSAVTLTAGLQRRFPVPSRDRQWLVHQAQYATGAAPALLPADGGGHVLLATDNVFYNFQGHVSVDNSGIKVAFAAVSPQTNGLGQVFKIQLDRELVIRPQLVINSTFQVDMPIANNEIGAVFLSGGLSPTVFTLPGFVYGLAVDATVLLPVVSGSSPSGKLSVSIPIPNNPWLIGFDLYWQGVRVTQTAGGDFTRYAVSRIF